MKRRSPLTMLCSLVLALMLSLTVLVMSPVVASAQTPRDSEALKALEDGIAASEAGNTNDAEFFFNKAIEEVLNNKDVDVLIVAKTRLGDIKKQKGELSKADRLWKQAGAGEKAIEGLTSRVGLACGECTSRFGRIGEWAGFGPWRRCVTCNPG